MQIREVSAKAILNSRKEETIEVSINNQKASSPSGKSTGKYETPQWHISLKNNIILINNFKELKSITINSFNDLKKVEHLIKNKFNLSDAKKFGANALFALESAILKALATSEGKELWKIINPMLNPKNAKFPIPVGNAIGGGLHSHNKNRPIFQEFLLIPKSKSIKQNVHTMDDVYERLKKQIKSKSINDEGALQTSLSDEEVLKLLSKFKGQVNIGLDAASSSFFCDGYYNYNNKSLDRTAQVHYINDLIREFNIFYLEDPLDEEDFSGFSKIKKKNLVVGDDLTATHINRLKKAIKNKSINATIIKPNQNGSLLELADIFKLCKKHKIKTVLSHRSGETLDSAIADLAFAFQADYIKCGIKTKWRTAKLNRLIEIEDSIK